MSSLQPTEKGVRVIAAVMKALDPKSEFTRDELYDMRRLLTACWCCGGVVSDSADPRDVRRLLNEVASGYGEWLRPVKQAIDDADIDDNDRSYLHGGFSMASAFLFDIFDQNRNAALRERAKRSPQEGEPL